MTDALTRLTTPDFLRLAHAAGVHIAQEDLQQLQRRQFFKTGSNDEIWLCGLHLYILALYLDAVKVVRHPWATRASDRKVEDVKVRAVEVQKVLDAIEQQDASQELAELASKIVIEMERYLAEIDPFGPISNIIDLLRPDIVRQLRGNGRLYVELRNSASCLAAKIEDLWDAAEEPSTGETPSEDPRRTTSLDVSEVNLESPRVVHENATVERTIAPDPPASMPLPSREATAPTPKPATPPDPEPTPTPPTPEPASTPDPEPASTPDPEPASTPDPEPAPTPDPEPAPSSEPAPIPPTPESAPEPEPAPTPDPEPPLIRDSFDEEEDEREATDLIEITDDGRTVRTQSLMKRLEQDQAKAAPTVTPEVLAHQIEELNQLRETYIKEQNWPALAALYEERIELFEDPTERQQIHLTLGTIYEGKLHQPRTAFESYVFAVETGGPSTERALEGVKRTGSHADSLNSYQAWLEKRIGQEDVSPLEKRTLHTDLASLLATQGQSQRAFLIYAAFLASDPESHITTETLGTLEELGSDQGEEGLDEFFSDILETTTNPRVVELVGLRGAMSFLTRGQNLLAIRNLRKVLEVAPNNEIAFSNLSRLYEAEKNYGDLASIIRSRLTRAPADLRTSLEAALERAYENELKTDVEAVNRWIHFLDQSPDDEHALRRAVFGFASHSRHAECYSFLSGLATNVKTNEQRARVLLQLAQIAIHHLDAPEEAQDYLEASLELTGSNADVLGGFVDLHLANRDFINAIAAVETLISMSDNMPKEKRIEWLHVGVEAAEQAHRGEEKEKFLAAIREAESSSV